MQKNITRTSRSFAIAHWDAQKARAPYVKRYIALKNNGSLKGNGSYE